MVYDALGVSHGCNKLAFLALHGMWIVAPTFAADMLEHIVQSPARLVIRSEEVLQVASTRSSASALHISFRTFHH